MWQARVVLPAPGHVDGLPAIPGLAAEAITAGQAVIFDSVGIVLVPTIDAHTTWKTFSQESSLVDPTTASASIRPEQARWAIRTAIADATTLLAATDTAAGRDAISDSMRRVQTELDRFTWPADTSPEQRATVLQAAQVLAIATTALHHDSTVHGSVNVTAARTQSLTDLAHTARRCLAAACSTR